MPKTALKQDTQWLKSLPTVLDFCSEVYGREVERTLDSAGKESLPELYPFCLPSLKSYGIEEEW